MPDQWFRFYNDAMNDPKVFRLGPDIFRAWVILLCLASKNGGEIPSVAEASFALRMNEQRAAAIVTELASVGLLDRVEGSYFAPHNWKGRQFKSDSSVDRVRAHRDRKRNATETPDETPTQQDGNVTGNTNATRSESEYRDRAESETEKQTDERARRASVSEAFKRLCEVYPKRDGSNPKEPARKKFEAFCKSGVDPAAIIAGVERYAAECQRKSLVGTEKVAQAVTFLHQRRWEDYPAPTETPAKLVEVEPGHGRFYPAIVKRLGDQVALSWFRGLRLVWIQGGVMRLAAPTKFVADRIHSFYDAELLLAVRSVDPSIELVEVVAEVVAA